MALSLILNKEVENGLKKIAYKRSYEEGRKVTYSSLVREAIEKNQ